jgi:PIN domain nuclease of toxin-antitoxin system
MKLLLDTHAFIWWSCDEARLPARVLEACRDDANDLVLSVASILEMEIKTDIGKLRLDMPVDEMVRLNEEDNDLQVLPVQAAHVYALRGLPSLHRDPFDRLLVAQAQVENASLVSGDETVAQYPVKVLW